MIFFSKFQVGLYQECVEAYEVVLGDGSLVRATKDNEYSDLYHCLPWSHGTLGLWTKSISKKFPKLEKKCFEVLGCNHITLAISVYIILCSITLKRLRETEFFWLWLHAK